MSVTRESIGDRQRRLLHDARLFADACAARGRNVALEPECYLTAWAPTRGQARLRRMACGWRAEPARLAWRARDALVSLLYPCQEIVGTRAPDAAFEQLIVSWAFPGDFDPDGHFRDRYFGLSTRDTPSALWLLMLMEDAVPESLPANVRVIRRARGSGVPVARPGARRHRFSGVVAQAMCIADVVRSVLRGASIRRVIVPYEAQPFQHALMLSAKEHDSTIETLGYMHSVMPAVPTEYVYRHGVPDVLLVNGEGQRDILCEFMGWPPERVRSVPSLRYRRDHAPEFAGMVLLPYSFDGAAITRQFETLMSASASGSMPRWRIRIHPARTDDPVHRATAARLESLIERYSDRTTPTAAMRRCTLIFGATAAIIEALERGFEVVHLCANPLFEKHSQEIWKALDVQEVGPGVFRYALHKPGTYIRLADKDDSAHAWLGMATRIQ
jgi:hypothetical protein